MSNSRHTLLVLLGFIAVILVGGALLVWPQLRERRLVLTNIDALEKKISGLSSQTHNLEMLVREVEDLRWRVENELKDIPDAPDPADLMMRLTRRTEKAGARDRTFTAGGGGTARAEENEPEIRYAALTLDLTTGFDTVFELIRAVENMPQLVRVASIHLKTRRDENHETPGSPGSPDTPGSSLVSASVGLEAIYQNGAE